jgi:hypothetical protein
MSLAMDETREQKKRTKDFSSLVPFRNCSLKFVILTLDISEQFIYQNLSTFDSPIAG